MEDYVYRFLKSVDLTRFPIPIFLKWTPPGPEYPGLGFLNVTMCVPERDIGTPTNVSGKLALNVVREAESRPDFQTILSGLEDTVFSHIQRMVCHELAECWIVQGKRVRDPHRPLFY